MPTPPKKSNRVPMNVTYHDKGVTVAFELTKSQMMTLGWLPMDYLQPVITLDRKLQIHSAHKQIREDSVKVRTKKREGRNGSSASNG